jgi:polar amino acid transport system substrate-binding protein
VDRTRILAVTVTVAVMLGVLTVVLLLVGCGDHRTTNAAAGDFTPRRAGVLTVATTLPAPGFWDGRDADHLTGGFEYDLAHDLAERFGLDRVEVVDVPFDRLVSGRATGFDLALAQVSITPERTKHVAFSVPYLTTPVGVAGRASLDVPDLAAARELRWGVGRSTTQVGVLGDLVRPEHDPKVYPTVHQAIAAAARGAVDVTAADWFGVLGEVAAAGKPEVAVDRLSLVAQITVPQNYGVLLPKGSDDVAAVDSALRALAADHTLARRRDRLYDRFDVDPADVPTIEVTP